MSETSQTVTDNEKKPKGARKRQVHNEIERRRKDKINGWISVIGELLPNKELHKQSKISILEHTVDYIKKLASEKEKLLSENRSEVQAQEVVQLKKELKLVQEQNAVYEKLLQQANINLGTLPKKSFKYSDKFERRNGVLTVKNTDTNISSPANAPVSLNGEVNNVDDPPIISSSSNNGSRKEKPSKAKTKTSKILSKNSSAKSKTPVSICPSPVTAVPVVETSNQTASCAVITSTMSIATINVVPQSSQISQGSVLPGMVCNDVAKDSTFHTGGVTTVLSQFPLMSTAHGSSMVNMCNNKNLSTIIIPSAGGILQHFPEKQSNTISIICPSTLPIIVPPQVFSVSSVMRNMSLPLICPGQAGDSQTDKSTLGNALLTINPSTVVPISSNISGSAQILLQPPVLGTSDLSQNGIQPLVNTLPQVTSDQIIVPLMQNVPTSSLDKCVQPPASAIPAGTNRIQPDKSKKDDVCRKTQKNNEPSQSALVLEPPQNGGSEIVPSEKSKSTVPDLPRNKNISPSKKIRSLSLKPLPSLQVLSANKIISLAKIRNSLPQKETPLLSNEEKSSQNSNNCSLVADAISCGSDNLRTNHDRSSSFSTPITNVTAQSSNLKQSEPISKSNFSLTVLMGDSMVENKTENGTKANKDFSECRDLLPTIAENTSTAGNNNLNVSSLSSIPTYSNVSISQKETTNLCTSQENNNAILNKDANDRMTRIEQQSAKVSPQNSSTSYSSVSQLVSSSKSVPSVSTVSVMSCGISTNDPLLKTNNTLHVNMLSKSNFLSKEINALQNNTENKQSNAVHSLVPVNSTSNFNENISFITNDSCQNQSILPSLFSSNQLVNLNTSVFVYPVQEVASNSGLLNQGSNTVPTTSINSYMIPNVCSNSSLYGMLNKENLSGSFLSTVPNDNSKVSNESVVSLSSSSGAHEPNNIISNASKNGQKNDKVVSTPCSKQISSAKKKRTPPKGKPVSADVHHVSNPTASAVNSDFELSKSQSTESPTSFPKSDDSICMRPESNNFIFTSDILARATESIFGSDMLEGSHMSKRSMIFYTDENSHLNVPASLPEKQQNDTSYKLLCLPSQDERTNMESSPSIISDNPKSAGADTIFSTNMADNRESSILNSHEIAPKQSKACKIRKSKSLLELEPPMKRIKDSSEVTNKSTNLHSFAALNQSSEIDKGHVSSSIHFSEKQVAAESQMTEGGHSVIDSVGPFGNQIHIPENNCKTPTSVDSILSITPSLGDILKDVSHGIGMENNRNNYLSCTENPSMFSGEKNFLTLNYSNNEEYLNLPRMHFPVVSEISTPVLQTTNVSFSHSLCSSQSESTKATESLSSTDPQSKAESKKKPIACNPPDNSSLNHNLVANNSMPKQADCVTKMSSSTPSFSIASKGQNSSSSMLFESQSEIHSQSINVSHSANSIISQAEPHFSSRDNFPVSHSVTFYPSLSNSSNIQNFVSSSSMLPHSNFHSSSSSNLTNLSFPIQAANTSTNSTFNSHSSTLPFSHSLCSLLKESNNGIAENRTGSNGPSSSSSSAPSNISQSKYSALSLISDHSSYSEPPTSSCHSEYVHNSVVCTPTVSDVQYTSTNSCSRSQRTPLSYSAESLLQTSCGSSDKNKNKTLVGNRYPQRLTEKKSDRNNITNMHNINDTNIFMPVTSCDVSIQNAPLVPLPPVTSFHNFPSTYTLCETVPSTTIFNSVSRTHDAPLSLSNENFLNHMSLTVDSQMLGNRHDVSSTVPKPHTNITIPFENHGSLYNNCSFLPHVKPTLENPRASEPGSCFPPASFSNSYSQKTNCCHFTHQTPTDHPANISLSVGPPSFHPDKSNFQSNCSSLQTPFTQSNTNCVGNLFYNASVPNGRNEMTAAKPSSSNRATQESTYVPEGPPRQNLHDHGPIFPPPPNNRKTASSNRSKSKKLKNAINEGNNLIPTSFSSAQETPKSCIPNGYYKNNSHAIIPPSPSQLPCSQHAKIPENPPNSVIPANPPFNLHQQGDNFFNLNFQPSNFTMSPLPRPPTQPLSCSCLTTPIISHTFSSTNHPVPNFNLSNILPDMGCSANQVPPLPPVKFPPVNHALQSSAQCQTNPSTISNSAHIISHQSPINPLYPPHPPIVRGPLNPILGHNPQSFGDGQVPLVASGAPPPIIPQNSTFSATQNPPFRNVIHSLSFPRSDR